MSRIILFFFLLSTLLPAQNTATQFFDETEQFLGKYVKENRVIIAVFQQIKRH